MENSTYGYYNGTYLYGGRVEICYNQTFYPVCDQGWTDNDAAVTCSNLGYYYYYYRELLRQMESLLMVAKQVVKQQMDRSMVCQMKHRYCRHQCAVELSIIYVIVGALPNVVGDYILPQWKLSSRSSLHTR